MENKYTFNAQDVMENATVAMDIAATMTADTLTFKNNYAKWAIGTPTLELIIKSYYSSAIIQDNTDAYTKEDYIRSLSEEGSINNSNYLTHNELKKYRYWLACPNSIDNVYFVMGKDKNIDIAVYNNTSNYIRPVVCLNSNVGLVWNEKTRQYDLYSN